MSAKNFTHLRDSLVNKSLAIFVLFVSLFPLATRAGEVLHLQAANVETRGYAAKFPDLLAKVNRKAVGYYVVQFNDKIGSVQRRDLTTLGAKILRYLPDDALIVRASRQQVQSIRRSLPSVHTVVPFASEWKVAQLFAPLSILTASAPVEILIRLFPGEEVSDFNAQVAAQKGESGFRMISSSNQSIVAEVPRAWIEKLAQIEGVEWIQPNPKFELLDAKLLDQPSDSAGTYADLTGYETGTHLMNVEAAWSRGLTGKGQIASMADTGLDKGDSALIHQDFAGRVPSGLIFGIYSKSWEDPMGHGTHVSGSVFGSGAASGGKIRGSAYEAQYIPESMWSPMLSNLSVPPKLSDLFGQAYVAGARIHTNSWGSASSFGEYDNFAQQVDEFAAAHPDMLILFAAGNSGVDSARTGRVAPNSISSPATAKNCLTVGASKNYVLKGGLQMKLSQTHLASNWPVEPLASSQLSENPQGLAPFSSRGPTADGRLKPEVVAPGTNILSVRSQVSGADHLWGVFNADYVWSGGTSMATPLTAGAATLVRQYLVDVRKLDQPSAALLKAVLMHTATDLFPGQFGAIGADRGQEILTTRPNNDEGFGRVDLAQATHLESSVLIDEKQGLSTGDAKIYPLHVSGAAGLTATLVYTDAAATASAKTALVNDLDLILVDRSGQETSLNDHLNNSKILQAQVTEGDYQIKVKGSNVPQGPVAGKQPYALVISLN